ncbi:MAG: hypothetical protein AB7U73_09440 [Pirellulales bacterium]
MNRTLAFGLAIFLAVVGIALLGGEQKASAGHCHGCCACDCGGDDCCSSSCSSCRCHRCFRCHRCHRCHRRCHRCHSCHSCHNGCSSCSHSDCCGGEPAEEGGEEEAEPTPTEDGGDTPAASRTPFGFRQVSFRR